MKISDRSTQYLRMVDSTSVQPVTAVNKTVGVLDPLRHPFQNTRAPEDDEARQKHIETDVVELSAQAQDTVFSQAKIEEMMHDKLAKDLETEGIGLSENQGLDYSPNAVAQRIVNSSRSLYGVFREQNSSMSEKAAMVKFEDIVRGAMDSGFSEAMKTLEELGLPDAVLDLARETKRLVDARFDLVFFR